MNAQERVTELTQKMLRRKLYAIFGKTVVPPEKLMPLLPAHLEYLIGLEKRGLLFASGLPRDNQGERRATIRMRMAPGVG